MLLMGSSIDTRDAASATIQLMATMPLQVKRSMRTSLPGAADSSHLLLSMPSAGPTILEVFLRHLWKAGASNFSG